MNKEILSIVEYISNKKSLPREIIFQALEVALSIATKKKYSYEINVRVNINRENGNVNTFRRWMIVLQVTKPTQEITLEAAQFENQYAKLNDYIEDEIKSVTFDRITIQTAKRVIIKKVREAEVAITINKFCHFQYQIITGIVKKIKKYYMILNLDNCLEVTLKKEDMIPRENFRLGDRVKGILYHVHSKFKGIQLFLSRTKPEMLIELFKIEVPEIKEKLVKIKAIARHPGFRSKVAVKSYDNCIDPIGSCIGIRGTRVQAVSKEMFGERIDIILWHDNPAQFVINAMAPANVVSVVVYEDSYTMDIEVDRNCLAQAIGQNGQNVRLASKLSGWKLNILTIDDLNKKNKIRMREIYNIFSKYLNLQKHIIKILMQEGFSALEEFCCMSDNELLQIQGINIDAVNIIRKVSNQVLSNFLLEKTLQYHSEKITDISSLSSDIDEKPMTLLLPKKKLSTVKDD
ncbi:Transcription termination/antitermination protein NusA [Buchnera aphidicola (Phyllaphis fagi)]|uniref:transcription termination factor NusA n=1 Tax=Buchnera aphidicola TaxID=9 RepID=UPI003A6ED88B